VQRLTPGHVKGDTKHPKPGDMIKMDYKMGVVGKNQLIDDIKGYQFVLYGLNTHMVDCVKKALRLKMVKG